MEGTIVGSREIRCMLAGQGHPKLSERALAVLIRQGMPRESHDRFDAERCLTWYVGKMRREAMAGTNYAVSELIMQRVESTVDEFVKQIVGLPPTQVEWQLGRYFRKLTRDLGGQPAPNASL